MCCNRGESLKSLNYASKSLKKKANLFGFLKHKEEVLEAKEDILERGAY